MKQPTDAVRQFFSEHEPKPERVLVAVSGGTDSIVLLAILADWKERPFELVAGFVDHGLRDGTEAELEKVEGLCERLGVELHHRRVDLDTAAIGRSGIEAAARRARYAALEEMATVTASDLIATAHHLDDQAETIVMRLLQRGSIPTLQGIRSVALKGKVVRPLLDVERPALEKEAKRRSLDPVSDPMNLDERFLRVRVRRKFLPFLHTEWPAVNEDLANLASAVSGLVRTAMPILDSIDAAWQRSENRSEIDLELLPPDPWLRRVALLRELRRLGSRDRSVSAALLGEFSREDELRPRSVGGGFSMTMEKGGLILSRDDPPVEEEKPWQLELEKGESAELPAGGGIVRVVRLDTVPERLERSTRNGFSQVIGVPGGSNPRFTIRTRRPGDRFHPLGSSGTRKLKSVLIDRKIPWQKRDRIPLWLVDDEICWIPGVEVSESFRVKTGRELYELHYTPSADR